MENYMYGTICIKPDDTIKILGSKCSFERALSFFDNNSENNLALCQVRRDPETGLGINNTMRIIMKTKTWDELGCKLDLTDDVRITTNRITKNNTQKQSRISKNDINSRYDHNALISDQYDGLCVRSPSFDDLVDNVASRIDSKIISEEWFINHTLCTFENGAKIKFYRDKDDISISRCIEILERE